MKNGIVIEIPDYVRAVMDVIGRYEIIPDEEFYRGRSYVVGGCIRDALLGRTPNDWDVTTNCPAESILEIFTAEDGFEAYPTGLAHGTVTVVRDHNPVEVTTFRSETAYVDHRHPMVVHFHDTVDCDLARRDFTVNAMAYSPSEGLIDLHGGMSDLENRLLRCVGEPEIRFNEDALRILRALRFASVLDFEIEEQTANAALKLRGLLIHISRERITAELEKLLCGKAAPRIIRRFHPIIEDLFPALPADAVVSSAKYIQSLGNAPFALKLAALLSDIDLIRINGGFMNLRLDSKTRKHTENLLRHLHTALDTPADIKRLCRDIGADAVEDIIRLGIARSERDPSVLDALAGVLDSGECYTVGMLKISGGELLSMGAVPREIGGMLEALLEGVIDGRLPNDRESLKIAAAGLINRKEAT